jgi:hypothetical protein
VLLHDIAAGLITTWTRFRVQAVYMGTGTSILPRSGGGRFDVMRVARSLVVALPFSSRRRKLLGHAGQGSGWRRRVGCKRCSGRTNFLKFSGSSVTYQKQTEI